MIHTQPSGAACGATVRGVDLSAPLDDATLAAVRAAWLEHGVLAFPDQSMSIGDLERITLALGPRGEDPFIAPIPGHAHVVEPGLARHLFQPCHKRSSLFPSCRQCERCDDFLYRKCKSDLASPKQFCSGD